MAKFREFRSEYLEKGDSYHFEPTVRVYISEDEIIYTTERSFLFPGKHVVGLFRKKEVVNDDYGGSAIRIEGKDEWFLYYPKQKMSILEFKAGMKKHGLNPKYIDNQCTLKELLSD